MIRQDLIPPGHYVCADCKRAVLKEGEGCPGAPACTFKRRPAPPTPPANHKPEPRRVSDPVFLVVGAVFGSVFTMLISLTSRSEDDVIYHPDFRRVSAELKLANSEIEALRAELKEARR